MVLNDAMELGVTSRVTADAMILLLRGLNWPIFESWLGRNEEALRRAHAPSLANLGADPKPIDGPKEHSGSTDASPPSNDEE